MKLQVREELEAIQQKYPERFKLWYTVDRPKEGNIYIIFKSKFINIWEIFVKLISRKI